MKSRSKVRFSNWHLYCLLFGFESSLHVYYIKMFGKLSGLCNELQELDVQVLTLHDDAPSTCTSSVMD